ncbi:MAG TPA: enoyl-CoA hydratase-related protein [Steroidobacteraceae bacterium]
MKFEDYTTLLFSRDGGILNVQFNNPTKLNSLSGAGEREISRFFYDVATDEETRVIVLSGAGRAFSAGGDIRHVKHVIEHPEEFYFGIGNAKRTVFNILDCAKPIIAKVNGDAAGLGATIALLCDVVFAANEAKFSDPHVKIGFTAGDGGAVIWPFLLGGLAKHYLMTGDPIVATDAAKLGMIFKALPPEELDEAVRAYAQRLATGPRRAIETTKLTANVVLKHLATMSMDAGMAYEALTNHSGDHQEACEAFLAKRPPQFTGQ